MKSPGTGCARAAGIGKDRLAVTAECGGGAMAVVVALVVVVMVSEVKVVAVGVIVWQW